MVVVNFLEDDSVQILDLWSTRNSMPKIDDKQDYNLVTSNITETICTVVFTRKLNTGDS